jgi:hypothetical protein
LAILLIFIGGTIVSAGILDKYSLKRSWKRVEDEKTDSAGVSWKEIGYKKSIRSIDSFLEQYGEKYRKKVEKMSKDSIEINPKVNYHFDNGNHLTIFDWYTRSLGGHVHILQISYDYSHYDHARRLQRELDKYLSARDLIERK